MRYQKHLGRERVPPVLKILRSKSCTISPICLLSLVVVCFLGEYGILQEAHEGRVIHISVSYPVDSRTVWSRKFEAHIFCGDGPEHRVQNRHPDGWGGAAALACAQNSTEGV